MSKSDLNWKLQIQSYDKRRDIIIPGNKASALNFSVEQFISIANLAIREQGYFAVALSGGSTPKEIFKDLTSSLNRERIDWSKVLVFWGDERSVPPTDPESNYKMAMEAGFSSLNIPEANIFRMKTERDFEENALEYEQLILQKIPSQKFDLIMLGMGEDGHTASLFPKTHGLHAEHRLVIANFVPQKNCWRISVTYECINQSKNIAIYVLGKSKAPMVKTVLTASYDPDNLPIQKVGTPSNHALWILDNESAEEL